MNQRAADAVVSCTIAVPPENVWEALTDPALIKQYFLGTNVTTSWQVGEPITYSGEFNGKSYEDRGTILVFDPPVVLKTTHFSPASGRPDAPENYHTVEYSLAAAPEGTTVTITQGNNSSEEEVEQSTATWRLVLQNLRRFLELRP
ncbi:SRPBCC domain-containing protein [Paenarthrobacter nitroguajacolicus]|uniref:SRPBCC domain-containing protein n=1 Tax=Paenarthrobacter nitroguajacolicus TaxID=211146 RepID=A0A558GXL7_PAENT|nr:SRPBCC domain-containing protein [Paenarthrobacter nitroguajacolicus]TVU61625.1 SRPBCC domain-containing protein [Paenarthrobacter nitroguajacolicus]